jgi:folate-binding protein YgfZ
MEVSRTIETALGEMHRRNGATMGVWFGCELPDRFEASNSGRLAGDSESASRASAMQDWEREYRWLREAVGLVDKGYRAYLEFTGPDRMRYLNAILTNDIKGLRENHGIPTLFLNPQGHIQAEMEVYAFGEKLFCVSYAMIREPLVPTMDKYIIMDDVTLTDRTEEFTTVAIEGPRAAAVTLAVSAVELGAMEDLKSHEANVGGVACRVSKRSPGEIASAEFLVAREKAEALWRVLEEAVRQEGGGPVGYLAINSARLEFGIPWFGYDFGEKQIPHEAGVQDSHISYTKGCYIGQEIVERVRSRGQVNRVRVSLRFDAEPAKDAVLLAEGKEVGYVTRVGFSPAVDAWIGMGYVRREKAGVGTRLELSGASATVVAAPIR